MAPLFCVCRSLRHPGSDRPQRALLKKMRAMMERNNDAIELMDWKLICGFCANQLKLIVRYLSAREGPNEY